MRGSKAFQDWFARGDRDLLAAQLLFKSDGPTDKIMELLQQAAEKYLKGYLISKGWRLKKTHNLVELVDEVIGYDGTFNIYLELAHQLTAYYFEARYPPGPPVEYTKEETKNLMKLTVLLIGKLKEAVG